MAARRTVILPGRDIASQPLWPELHRMINTSYHDKEVSAFPSSWTRLDADPTIGAQALARELGLNGFIAVILLNQTPIACGGVYPYPRHDAVWGSDLETTGVPSGKFQLDPEATSASSAAEQAGPSSGSSTVTSFKEWEVCCFCVHPDHRHQRLGKKLLEALVDHIRPLGAKHVFLNFVLEETGAYWPYMGFKQVPGLGGILERGWTHTEGVEGLKSDVHLVWGVKEI